MNAGMPLFKVNIADIVLIEIYFCSEESLLNNKQEKFTGGGGWWQTKFSVSPGPGLLVLGPWTFWTWPGT